LGAPIPPTPDASAIRGPRFGLAGKIFLASTILVVAVLGATFGVTSLQANRTADAAVLRALTSTRRAVDDFLAGRTRAVAGMSKVSAGVPQFRERLLTARERANALDQAQEYRDLIGAAWVLVTDHGGVLIARTDYPEEFGQNLEHAPLVAAALEGEQTSGAWLDDFRVKMFIAVGTPLRASPSAAPQGTLVAAYEVDDSLAHAVSAVASADVVFFMLDTLDRPLLVASTLDRETVAEPLRDSAFVAALAADTLGAPIEIEARGGHLIGRAGTILSPAGDLRGGFVAFRSRAAELAAFGALRRTMWLAIVLGVGLALVSAFLLARQIARPVKELAVATRRVQDGDYDVVIAVRSSDEIGVLAGAFKRLVDDLKEKADLVEYMMSAAGAAETRPVASGRPSLAQGGELLRPGSVFAGRYEVKEILGMGGMGVVYRALDRELGEPVAIKTLRPEATGDSLAVERFKQEIRLARRITHRNVVRTYDLGEVGGMYYLTMEFVEGTSLKQLISARGSLPVAVTLTIGKQLSRALEVAHEQGVIHRDIKPQNIVVEPSGFIKVMDFGIARLAKPPAGKGLTAAGMTIGTLDYMSPEQLTGEEVDARSDLYAAGVVLFECVTGRLPFVAETAWAVVAQHLEEPPPDPRTLSVDVPEALAQLIVRALAKAPAQRPQSAAELHDALDRIAT